MVLCSVVPLILLSRQMVALRLKALATQSPAPEECVPRVRRKSPGSLYENGGAHVSRKVMVEAAVV